MQNVSKTIGSKHIEEYLNFYIELIKPGYAVMIDGEWGSGKTWFIEQYRKNCPRWKFLYVSLYGASSIAEVEDRIFKQSHPILASLGTIFKVIIAGIQSYIPLSLTKSDVPKLFTGTDGKILIFDDLERCDPDFQDKLFGYINSLVEHGGDKVVLLAYKDKIPNFEEYLKRNEKLIGRTFTIGSSIDVAIHVFIANLNEPKVRVILEKNIPLILEIYNKDSYNNLRTLKHSAIEFERFFRLLPEKAQQHPEFQSECISTFFSLNLEIRKGEIEGKDVGALISSHEAYRMEKTLSKRKEDKYAVVPNKVAIVMDKYFGFYYDKIVPNEQSLGAFFVYGTVPEDIMKQAIENNKYFLNENTPTWRKLWSTYDIKNAEFEGLLQKLMEEFTTYKIVKAGEIKHVAGILIFLARNGIVKESLQETMDYLKKVINEMVLSKMIHKESKRELFPMMGDIYGGHQFKEIGTEEFGDINDMLEAYQDERDDELARQFGRSFSELLEKDPTLTYCILTLSNTKDQIYYNVPVLNHVDIGELVVRLIKSHPKIILSLMQILQKRYAYLNACEELLIEHNWLKTLDQALAGNIALTSQTTAYHLKQLREQGTLVALAQVEKYIEHKKGVTNGTVN